MWGCFGSHRHPGAFAKQGVEKREAAEAEGIALDGEHLLVSADAGDGDLHVLPISKLSLVRE